MATIETQPTSNTYVLYRFYEEYEHYPLSHSFVFLTGLVIVYLAFVLKIGPDFMKNRPPYSLKNTILVYNAVQVIISFLFVILTLRALLSAGLFPTTSAQFDPKVRDMIFIGVYTYFLGKITELLDTVFFVLRKKYNQVTFLHVYHHASVIIGTWLMVFYSINQSINYSAFINSLVHVVMYFYYFMAALGPQYQKYLFWKKYITSFQLIQFVTIFVHQVISLFVTKGEHTIVGLVYLMYSSVLFYNLFKSFYNQSYKKSNKNGAVSESTQSNVQSNGIAKEQ